MTMRSHNLALFALVGLALAACSGGVPPSPTEVSVPAGTQPTEAAQSVSAATTAPGDDTEGPLIPDGFIAAADPKGQPAGGAQLKGAAQGLGADEADTYVAAHNRWRANYGTPPLAWDGTVAAYAQEWADNLAATDGFEHRTERRYGENLWKGSSGYYTPDNIVDDWGSEVKDWDVTCTLGINACCQPGAVCGHFTQVVWSTSTRLGCGKATTASGQDVVVCNYAPAGNYRGQQPFPPQSGAPTAVPATAEQPTASRPTAVQPTSAPPTGGLPTAIAPTAAPGGSAAPATYSKYWDNIGLQIPDGGDPVSKVMSITKAGTLLGVGVGINITHPYVGDLTVTLVHPDGTEVLLRDQVGGNGQNINATYGLQGIPVAGLAALKGKPMAGDWQLVVQDNAAEDSGTLNKVTLYFQYAP